jgi:L-lactate dehydrogenase (cytochrome)
LLHICFLKTYCRSAASVQFEGGLDILRAVALGADFVFLGKAFHYALGALGEPGLEHLVAMLKADLVANMGQLAARRLTDVRACLLAEPLRN